MNTEILSNEVQEFVESNLSANITELILKGSPFDGVSVQELANQVVAKQKSKLKLPTWFATQKIYYPPKISIEQTSSELTAEYKSSLISGKNIADITGGFGVDCFAFSKKFDNVIHCEINQELSSIVKYNYKQLGVKNITTVANNGIDFLKSTDEYYDCIYIDPSRRNDSKGKVFLLKDCLPNVPEYLDFLLTKTDIILIKNSPMLDISATINELKYVKEIHIVAVENEVKELLFLLQKGYEKHIEIKTVNLSKKGNQCFDFIYKNPSKTEYSVPLTYLYEPNTAILKSGGFKHITEKFKIKKLHQHSHLFTSKELINFTGRRFEIINHFPYQKKQLLKTLSEKKANITIRNFPKSVAQIRQETKLKDGGSTYLFFTTNHENKKIVIICQPIAN